MRLLSEYFVGALMSLTLAEDGGVGRGMRLFNCAPSDPADPANVDEISILGEEICESVHVMPIPCINDVPHDRLDGILRGRVRGGRRRALGKSQHDESSHEVTRGKAHRLYSLRTRVLPLQIREPLRVYGLGGSKRSLP